MNVRGIRAGLAIAIGAALVAVACHSGPPAFRGLDYPNPIPVEEFVLVDHDGEEFRLSEQRGRVVLLFFGYVHCPDVCPMTLSTWRRIEQALGPLAREVRFVFVTVDPERDTPERLGRHLAAFSREFHGLSGSSEQLRPIYGQFGIVHEKVAFSESAAAYVVDHTTRVYLVDPAGLLRLSYGFETSAETIVHDIRLLLESRGGSK